MNKFITFFFVFLFSGLAYAQKHVVFDLDWTLINKSSDEASLSKNAIDVLGEKYFISAGAEDVMTALANDSRVKISFFSGGDTPRNIEALKKMKLTDGSGRSFYDIAYKVLSKEQLTDTGLPATAKFAERYKKDLTLITNNLNDVILVDDIAGFSLQKGNDLYLGRTYTIYENYSDAEKAFKLDPTNLYIPGSRPAWVVDRYKIPATYGIIDEALDASEKGESFAGTVRKLSVDSREQYVYMGLDKIKMSALARKLKQESIMRQQSIQKMRKLFKMPKC